MNRILLIEDDEGFAYLIKKALQEEDDMQIIAHATNPTQGLALALELKPDIVLSDLSLTPGCIDGVETAKAIRLRTNARIIFLTVFEDPKILVTACQQAFASGYIFKSQFTLLVDSIRSVVIGSNPQAIFIKSLIESKLSPAEKYVFQCIINNDMNIQSSKKTISNQQTSILNKLGLTNKHELIHIFNNY